MRSRGQRAYTLIEILTAISILGILVVLVSQIISATFHSSQLSYRIMDADSQARLAFDRIGVDLAGMVKRKDLDFYAGNPPFSSSSGLNSFYPADFADNSLAFVSRVTSPGGDRCLSVVTYRVDIHPDNKNGAGQPLASLLRSGQMVGWNSGGNNGVGFMGLNDQGFPVRFSDASFPSTLLPNVPTTTSGGSFNILAPGVLRMMVGFQLYPDNDSVALANAPNTAFGSAQGQIVYNAPLRTVVGRDNTTKSYIDLDRISAIVIGLVVLDTENLKLLSASNVTDIASRFTIPQDTDNLLPVQAWASTAERLSATPPVGVPAVALRAVRVYQRTYPLTPFPSKPQ